jgi:hypothetical protein
VAEIINQDIDKSSIGRQITLPLSKAFEIAWKGIKIRIWRSLITMSGIILAIAFLMSVWTAGIFNDAMQDVPPTNERYSLVQSVLEQQAIASGAVDLQAKVIEPVGMEGPTAGITPGSAIVTNLEGAIGVTASPLPADAGSIVEAVDADHQANWPDALIFVGFPEVLNEAQVVEALKGYLEENGFVLFFGARGLTNLAQAGPMRELLPALPDDSETVSVPAEARLTVNTRINISGLQNRNHPAAVFLQATAQGEGYPAVTASPGEVPVLWWRSLAEGSKGGVAWYPIHIDTTATADVLSWFVSGRAAGASGAAQGEAMMSRVVSRGARANISEGGGNTRGLWLVILSLLVCLVGITNAMLMSVTERFREIGTMKCLGALDSFIVKLFLIESSLQGIVGSLLGAIIGFGLAFTRAAFTFKAVDLGSGEAHWLALEFFPGLPLFLWMIVAIVVGILLSVAAAIYPAMRAAKMAPVDAMRAEA